MNWAFFVVRFVIIAVVLSLFFFSQRFWHRAIWRSTANFRSQWLRVAARLLWLGMIFLVISAFIDGVRMGHRHLIPRGTILPALVGLWFFSAVFGFVAVKFVRGVDLLWSRMRKNGHGSEPATLAAQPGVSLARAATVEKLRDPGRRYFFRAATAAAGAAPFLGAMYGYAAERLKYQVHREEIPISNLNPALDGLSIVQISDIHLSGYMPRAQVQRAVEMANELGAHLAVVTGDFITGASDPLPDCIEEIRQLRAALGIWGCNGNHEIYARVEDLAQSLFAQAGMKLLRGENAQLTFNGAQFNLIGVDYQRERTSSGHKKQTLIHVEQLVRRDMPNILLSHNPNSFPRAAELGIELSLAGHTHGGQIQVEILDHRLSPARFITDYIAGLYQRPLFAPSLDSPQYSRVDGYAEAPRVSQLSSVVNSPGLASLYVNRGLGTVGAPVRIGVPPEITLIVLRRA
ncbi:MAG TPA: metallophosphoesterase [Candidatus Acidoferrum sp.]|nr:metallophosphoesterase [Candidatus Acidoferrum sp.]